MMELHNYFLEHCPESNHRYPRNDIGVAQLFLDYFEQDLCYVVETKSWYAYDGQRWAKDSGDMQAMEYCKAFALELNRYAKDYDYGDYPKFTSALASRKRRESILKDARSICPQSLQDFDRDKHLFNCLNGTFNLETMKFQPHSPDDRITKLSNVSYEQSAGCSRWEDFVAEVMQGDTETACFLQKSLGYSLSGRTDLECFFILYGNTTRNGKSTTCETVAHLMGEYARTAQPETLARRRADGSAPSPDVARLKGARFVNMPEPERGLELNASLIKQLTGGDTYTGRMLNENPVEFIPEFKIYIDTNHLPRVGDDTIFQSERVKLIPFERHFSPQEQDTGLKARFRQQENISGIFNWLVQGYSQMLTEGLAPPHKVLQATQDYRDDSDVIGTFLKEALVGFEGSRLKTSVVYNTYKGWAAANGYHPLNNKNFVAELRKRYTVVRDGRMGNAVEDVQLADGFPW